MNRDGTAPGPPPPPGMEWVIGKTVEALHFVGEGEEYLRTITGLGDDARKIIEARIARIKTGEDNPEPEETFPVYLRRLAKQFSQRGVS